MTNNIVVLGKKLLNNLPDKEYRQRLGRVFTIANNQPNRRIYILGGVTSGSKASESRAGKNYLEDKGMPAEQIYIEEKSRDTLDNMKQLQSGILTKERHIVLITNRYHLARSSTMARSFGFYVEKCAAEDCFTLSITNVIKILGEAFFLHWYLSGLIYAKITHNQRMLNRMQ